MDADPLDRLRDFHRHLAALDAAGVPLALWGNGATLRRVFEKIESRLAVRVELGQPLPQAVESERDLPANYRCAAMILLASDDASCALEAIRQSIGDARQSQRPSARLLITPLIITVLVYGGAILLCNYTAPRIAAVYEQAERTPGYVLLTLLWLREWLSVWAFAVPAVTILGVVFACRTDAARWLRLAPPIRALTNGADRAALADHLAKLSEHHLPLQPAAPLAPALGDRAEIETWLTTIDASRVTDRSEKRPPALLRWALQTQESPDDLAGNLRVVARCYQQNANRRSRYWSAAAPVFTTALVGGVLLLTYGYALFTPFVRLMHDLAQPTYYNELQASPGTVNGVAKQ